MEDLSHEMGEAGPHLDAGALSAERQTRTHREQSAQKFHRDQEKRGRWKFPSQDRLDVRNAAPMGLRRTAAHQSSRNGGRRGAAHDNTREAERRPAMSPRNESAAHTVRLREREPEDCADESRKRARNQSDQRKRQETALGGEGGRLRGRLRWRS